MSVYDSERFHERVNYAARCLLAGSTSSRAFDTCFEMFDGDMVVTALVRRAEQQPHLSQAIIDWYSKDEKFPQTWIDAAAKYVNVTNLAAKAREIRNRERERNRLAVDALIATNQTA